MPARTQRTITSRDKLEKQLLDVAHDGYAVVLEEFEIGLNSMAVPVYNHLGTVIGAVSISGPAFRFDPEKTPGLIEGLGLAGLRDQRQHGLHAPLGQVQQVLLHGVCGRRRPAGAANALTHRCNGAPDPLVLTDVRHGAPNHFRGESIGRKSVSQTQVLDAAGVGLLLRLQRRRTIGTPRYSASMVEFIPVWERKTSAWRKTSSCGKKGRTSTFCGISPSSATFEAVADGHGHLPFSAGKGFQAHPEEVRPVVQRGGSQRNEQ